jgi:hypothetical protein
MMGVMYEVILNGDRAQADSEEAALLAARTLISDNATAYGVQRMLRRDVIVTQAGTYDSRLTRLAREGR